MVRFLTSINKNQFMAWVSFFSLIANVLLNYILIEQFEIYGLVIATVIINISGFVFYTIYTHKQFRHATINFN
jgi:putative peptidoglycan lipid II flippase